MGLHKNLKNSQYSREIVKKKVVIFSLITKLNISNLITLMIDFVLLEPSVRWGLGFFAIMRLYLKP